MTVRSPNDLIRIAAAGGGFSIDASAISTNDLICDVDNSANLALSVATSSEDRSSSNLPTFGIEENFISLAVLYPHGWGAVFNHSEKYAMPLVQGVMYRGLGLSCSKPLRSIWAYLMQGLRVKCPDARLTITLTL